MSGIKETVIARQPRHRSARIPQRSPRYGELSRRSLGTEVDL